MNPAGVGKCCMAGSLDDPARWNTNKLAALLGVLLSNIDPVQ
jgi:hypothetical protein